MKKSSNRRQNLRILGPFDGTRHGLFDLPLQIYDLSIGGCFVKWVHDSPHNGQLLSIRIELPSGDAVVTKAETAFVSPGFGFGVKFCQLSNENRMRLETALEIHQHSGSVQD
jgi:PilZ domain